MPNKTVYVRDVDLALWDAAQQKLGESISALFAEFLREKLKKMDAFVHVLHSSAAHNSTSRPEFAVMIAPVQDTGNGGPMKPYYARGNDHLCELLKQWGIPEETIEQIEHELKTKRSVSVRTPVLRSLVNVHYRLWLKPVEKSGSIVGVVLSAIPTSEGVSQWERKFHSVASLLDALKEEMGMAALQIMALRNCLLSGRETQIGGSGSGVSFSVPEDIVVNLGMTEKLPFHFRNILPRLHELRDLVSEPDSSNAFFQRLEETLENSPSAMRQFEDYEKELSGLDPEAWRFLKDEAARYLMVRHRRRGWQQLFDILNQARAYNYLVRSGCSDVGFIPRLAKQGVETPDIEAMAGSQKIVCEVKTINISDDEARLRGTPGIGRRKATALSDGFFSKLESDIAKAVKQLSAYDPTSAARRVVYFNVCFDDHVAEYKEEYFRQIDAYLLQNPFPGVEIVFHNDHTAFYKPLKMVAATVVNSFA
jgi:hypothetical protein